MSEWRFKRDTTFRKGFFVPDSFSHPAKMDAQLLIKIVETYTKVGDVILDPMFGSGTTMLACTLGRNVIGVELEQKFVDMAKTNWEKVRSMPMMGYEMGTCTILHGDARNLEGLLADAIITSPPYEASDVSQSHMTSNKRGEKDNPNYRPSWKMKIDAGYCETKRPYVDHIITSPPYEAGFKGEPNPEKARQNYAIKTGRLPSRAGMCQTEGAGYSGNVDNIGNLKSTSYLEAMLAIYRQCHAVLKPEGLMILVTKNFIRDRQIVRLDTDTIRLCEEAGFHFVERHYRKLSSQSFWRTIYKQKYPGAPELTHEDILVFSK